MDTFEQILKDIQEGKEVDKSAAFYANDPLHRALTEMSKGVSASGSAGTTRLTEARKPMTREEVVQRIAELEIENAQLRAQQAIPARESARPRTSYRAAYNVNLSE